VTDSGRPSVCVIGAGAAGLMVADSLARAGCRVTIVEGGAERPVDQLEDTFRVRLTGTPHRGVHEGRFRGMGGSTTRWGGQLWPWESYEFEARPYLGLDGWPIGFGDVAPWYDRAFSALGISHPTLSPGEAAARGALPPPLDPQEFALKYSTWLPWRLRNLARTIGRRATRNPNVAVQLRTTAVGIEAAGPGARATGVRVSDPHGRTHTIAADAIVLACGTVESTRLLFACQGIGVPSAWLGRGFMDHLSVRIARFIPRNWSAFDAMFAPVFVRDVQFTPRMLLRPHALEREGLLSSYGHWDIALPPGSGLSVVREKLRAVQAGGSFSVSAADLRSVRRGVQEVISLARGVLIDHRRHFPRDAAIHLRVDSEQQPDGASRLVPTGEHDALGLPRLALDWQVSPLERHTVRRTAQLLGAELERTGVGALTDDDDPFAEGREWGALRGDSFHMMGGTRMALDASNGVVDRDARVFGTENVYVAGASVFPTGGMANPTLTLLALALRLANHLVRTF